MLFANLPSQAAAAIVILSLPAAGFAQSNQIQQIMRYCKPYAEQLCPGAPPSGGRIARAPQGA
jgi:hypothetical protein